MGFSFLEPRSRDSSDITAQLYVSGTDTLSVYNPAPIVFNKKSALIHSLA